MEEEKQRVYTIVIVTLVAALLLSCVAGAFAGGLAGMVLGRAQGRAAAERVLSQGVFPEMPMPWGQEEMPWGQEESPRSLPEQGQPLPFEGTPGIEGAVVVEVVPGAPADEAGLEPGDVIVAVDGVPIDRNHILADVVAQYEPGDRVVLVVWRDGQEQSLRTELDENPDDPARPYLGVRYQMNLEPEYNLPGG